jgi:hypothetical protein
MGAVGIAFQARRDVESAYAMFQCELAGPVICPT